MTGTKRNTQYIHALRELRQLILDGDFESNARLSEASIAERLGISRTPLRQAMDRLVEESLLERIETGGCRVASFAYGDIEDAIELRGVIEGIAARLAAERGIKPADQRECEEILSAIDVALKSKPLDFEQYVLLNADFHSLLASLAGSNVLRREVERVNKLPLASPSAFLQGQELIPDFQASLEVAHSQHRAIFDAISRREGARAESLMREHARLARQNLDHVMQFKSKLTQKVPGLALVSNG